LEAFLRQQESNPSHKEAFQKPRKTGLNNNFLIPNTIKTNKKAIKPKTGPHTYLFLGSGIYI
jgi:hypothetical protein